MSYLLEPPLIDLAEYGKSREAGRAGKAFALHILSMATEVIRRGMPAQELIGIRACLRYQVRALRWNNYVWRIPAGTEHFSDTAFEAEGRTYVLPNSVVATTLFYRAALDEHSSGLSRLVFSDMVHGLERACQAGVFGYPVTKHPDLRLFGEEDILPFIASQSLASAQGDA